MCIYWLSCFGGDLFSCFSTALLSKSERRDWESYALRWMFCCWSQVSTFIMMYRTHCQRILDTVIRANFDEARCLLNLKRHALSASFICNAKRHGFFFFFLESSGPKLLAALLAGHATPHAPCPRLPHRREHRWSLWLHTLQGHLWCADAHCPASAAR